MFGWKFVKKKVNYKINEKKFPQRDTFLILIPKKVYNVFLPQIMFRKLFDKGNKSLREIV